MYLSQVFKLLQVELLSFRRFQVCKNIFQKLLKQRHHPNTFPTSSKAFQDFLVLGRHAKCPGTIKRQSRDVFDKSDESTGASHGRSMQRTRLKGVAMTQRNRQISSRLELRIREPNV